MKRFAYGSQVAWTMLDGNVMAGTIVDAVSETYQIKRVDGTVCYRAYSDLHVASNDEILAACQFFADIGKPVLYANHTK